MIQNGIHLKKTVEEDEEDGVISNKKPRKAALAKAKLYGCFVKVCFLFYWENIIKICGTKESAVLNQRRLVRISLLLFLVF